MVLRIVAFQNFQRPAHRTQRIADFVCQSGSQSAESRQPIRLSKRIDRLLEVLQSAIAFGGKCLSLLPQRTLPVGKKACQGSDETEHR